MVADAILRNALQSVVQRLDAQLGPAAIRRETFRLHDHPHRRQHRVVHLQEQPRIDDGLILLLQRIGDGVDIGLLRWIVLVPGFAHEACRGDDGHEGFFDADVVQRVFEVVDVAQDLRLVVANRPVADDDCWTPLADGVRRVEIGKLVALAAEAVVHRRPRRRRPELEAGDPVQDVAGPVGLAELAVADDVQPNFSLLVDGLRN